MSKRKTHESGRDSKNGQFISVEAAKKRPNTTTIENVPNPGYGDTKGLKKKTRKSKKA